LISVFMGVIPFVWFLVVGFAVRYPVPGNSGRSSGKISKRRNFLTADYADAADWGC
jgi:hypothetical protein